MGIELPEKQYWELQPKSAEAMKQSLEQHLGMSWEAWREQKREEWTAVLEALARFQIGSALTPVYETFLEVEDSATVIAEKLEREWVSW